MLIAIAILVVAIIGAMGLGRWLQRKGTDIEQHHHNDRPPSNGDSQ